MKFVAAYFFCLVLLFCSSFIKTNVPLHPIPTVLSGRVHCERWFCRRPATNTVVDLTTVNNWQNLILASTPLCDRHAPYWREVYPRTFWSFLALLCFGPIIALCFVRPKKRPNAIVRQKSEEHRRNQRIVKQKVRLLTMVYCAYVLLMLSLWIITEHLPLHQIPGELSGHVFCNRMFCGRPATRVVEDPATVAFWTDLSRYTFLCDRHLPYWGEVHVGWFVLYLLMIVLPLAVLADFEKGMYRELLRMRSRKPLANTQGAG
jgi:hypothetical protein